MLCLDLGGVAALTHLAWWLTPLLSFGALCGLALRLPTLGGCQATLAGHGSGALPGAAWARVFLPLWLLGVSPLLLFRGVAATLLGSQLGISAATLRWWVAVATLGVSFGLLPGAGLASRRGSFTAELTFGGLGMLLVWGLLGGALSLLTFFLLLEVATLGVLLLLTHGFLLTQPGLAGSPASQPASPTRGHLGFMRALLIFFWLAALASLLFFWATAAGFHSLRSLSLPDLCLRAACVAPSGGAAGWAAPLGLGYALGFSVALKLMLPPCQLAVLLFYRQVTTAVLAIYLAAYYVFALGALLLVFGVQLAGFLAPWLALAGIGALGVALALGWAVGHSRDLRGVLGVSTALTLTLLLLFCTALA